MIALYVILGILAFFILLLIIPVRLEAEYKTELGLVIHYLFLHYTVLPEKHEQADAQKTDKPEKKEHSEKSPVYKKIKKLIDQKGVSGFLSLTKAILMLLGSSLKNLITHIKIGKLDIYFLAAAEDACSAAMLYGEACAAIYPAVSALCKVGHCSHYGVTVDLDYNLQAPEILAHASCTILPIYLLKEGFKLLLKGIPYIRELK